MKRKKFIKNMMSVGIGRNAANWVCREHSEAAVRLIVQIQSIPGFYSLTGVAQANDGLVFRVKRLKPE